MRKTAFKRRLRHFGSAIGMNRQRSGNDVVFRDRLFDEVLGDFGVCAANKHPTYDETAEDIKHYQESEPLAAIGAAKLGVSSAGESHPRALAEPDVNFSAHPAPITEPPL